MRNLLANLKFRTKIGIGFSAVLFFLIVISSVGQLCLQRVNESFLLAKEAQIAIAQINLATKLMVDVETSYRGFLLSGEENYLEPYTKGIQAFDEQTTILKNLLDDPAQIARIETMREKKQRLMNDYFEPRIQMRRNVEQGLIPVQNVITAFKQGQTKAIMDEIRMVAAELTTEQERIQQVYSDIANRTVVLAGYTIGGVTLFALIISIVFATLVSGAVVRPITQLREAAEQIAVGNTSVFVAIDSRDEAGILAKSFNSMVTNIISSQRALSEEKASVERKVEEAVRDSEAKKQYLEHSVDAMLQAMRQFANGDLTVRIPVQENDDIGRLFEGFNHAVGNIHTLMEQVQEAVMTTASASAQISSSTLQLSAASEEQSHQAQDVSASVEEMAHTITENASNAMRTSAAAQNNGKAALEGGDVVRSMITTIQRINQTMEKSVATVERLGASSTEIGDIVSVIDEIADQTNLLALNAAIEAARAGDQGRGFAVVADEVRKLAERTTQATKQIAGTIKSIQQETAQAVTVMNVGNQEVVEGISMAHKAGVSLETIVQSSQEVVEMVKQIATASEQQAITSSEMAQSINTISDVTSESAKGIAQIATTAEDLNRLTEHLQMLIRRFTMNNQQYEESVQYRLTNSSPSGSGIKSVQKFQTKI